MTQDAAPQLMTKLHDVLSLFLNELADQGAAANITFNLHDTYDLDAGDPAKKYIAVIRINVNAAIAHTSNTEKGE